MSLRSAVRDGKSKARTCGMHGRTVLETVLILLMLCILLSVVVEKFISSVVVRFRIEAGGILDNVLDRLAFMLEKAADNRTHCNIF